MKVVLQSKNIHFVALTSASDHSESVVKRATGKEDYYDE